MPIFISDIEVGLSGITFTSCNRGVPFPESPHKRNHSAQVAVDQLLYVMNEKEMEWNEILILVL